MKNYFFLFLLFPGCLSAQKNIQKAAIVTNNDETFYGFVDDRQWAQNPVIINIKRTLADKFEKYTANQIKSIKIENGNHYASFNVKIDNSPPRYETESPDSSLIKIEEKNVFLQIEFLSNEYNLYSLIQNNGLHLYIQKGDKNLEELVYRNYTVRRNGGYYEIEEKKFVNQLNYYLDNCQDVQKKLADVNYSSSAIAKLLSKYIQQCGSKQITYTNETGRKGIAELYFLAGTAFNSLQIIGSGTNILATTKPLKSDPAVVFGVRLNYILKKMQQKLSIQTEIYYNKFLSHFEERFSETSVSYIQKTTKINPAFLRISFAARYHLAKPSAALRPYLQAGFSMANMLSIKTSVTTDNYYDATHHESVQDPTKQQNFSKLQAGLTVGGGLKYKNLSLDYRY